jgi:hypothetical protein
VNEQRKTRRFELKLPIELIRSGGDTSSQMGETKNLSSSGVLFISNGKLQKGDAIEYFVTLPTAAAAGLRLRCMGKVVRVEEGNIRETDTKRTSYAIAATLERHEFVRK